jgi:hypothetical protein
MIDHDECLRIKNIETGRYDVKLAGKIGRVCQNISFPAVVTPARPTGLHSG